jgi:hypothetical protein
VGTLIGKEADSSSRMHLNSWYCMSNSVALASPLPSPSASKAGGGPSGQASGGLASASFNVQLDGGLAAQAKMAVPARTLPMPLRQPARAAVRRLAPPAEAGSLEVWQALFNVPQDGFL